MRKRSKLILLTCLATAFTAMPAGVGVAQEEEASGLGTPVQTAIISEEYGYLNLSTRGGRPTGPGVDNDGAPGLQQASMTATFNNFELNGISYDDWQECRTDDGTVDDCLAALGPTLREQHPGAIGGDTFAFDVEIRNTSPDAVLTTFAFQSKFSESPALGSRIGDKLFSAERIAYDGPDHGLVGVKKNGTTNGLFGGKIKGICINSSTDYPSTYNLGVENETLECAGGRILDPTTFRPELVDAEGTIISPANIRLPKGLMPGEVMTMRILLDAGTDDGALHRAYGGAERNGSTGPLVGTLEHSGEFRAPESAAECLELDPQPADTVVDVVNFGDVKIIRDAEGNCAPSFDPFSQNQFLTVPRRNWGFTDILDTRDDHIPEELPTVLTGATGKFSLLDVGQLRPGEMNFFEILRGFGEHGETLDPSCEPGGSRAGSCGGAAYVPWAEFYAIADGKLVRQEVVGTYGDSEDGASGPSLTATIDTNGQDRCRGGNLTVMCKTTDPFETPGQPNPGAQIGAAATATFHDVVVISDDKSTVENEGGQAGGDKVRFTINITNTSPSDSGIYLTSFNFQTKERGLTDINDRLDGSSILGRQDMRRGATLADCTQPDEVRCKDTSLFWSEGGETGNIGRFPNVLGNSLLSSVFAEPHALDQRYGTPDQAQPGKLEAIKKNGTFQPLMKADERAANFICIKSGAASDDQDADETCAGTAGQGLAPGESQTVRLELDYGDFRGLILQVTQGTLVAQDPPFGLLAQGGDFDCRDQRRLPYCHPSLTGDWFTSPTTLEEIEFVTVHQPGDAATVMNFTDNFGAILAMGGFSPTAEFWQGSTQVQVKGIYDSFGVAITNPDQDARVNGTVELAAVTSGTDAATGVQFLLRDPDTETETDIGAGTDADGVWTLPWDTTDATDGLYDLVARASRSGGSHVEDVKRIRVTNGLFVEIVEPDDGAILSGTVQLVAETAGLSPATNVEFMYADLDTPDAPPVPIGSAVETMPGSGIWQREWTTSGNGDFQLIATATNAGESATDEILVQLANAFVVQISSPKDGDVVSGEVEVQATASVADPFEVEEVEFFVDGEQISVDDTPSDGWKILWDTTQELDGEHLLTAHAIARERDPDTNEVLSEQVGSTSEAVAVVTHNFTVTITAPSDGDNVHGSVAVEASAQSPFAVTGATLWVDRTEFDQGVQVGGLQEGAGPFTFDWDTTEVADGEYTLTVVVTDGEDQTAEDTVAVTVANAVTVTITAPGDDEMVSDEVTLRAETTGPVAGGVTFTIGDSDPIDATGTSPGVWEATWNTTLVDDGDYTITAAVAGEADSVDVTVNNAQPGGELAAFFPFDWTNCNRLVCDFVDASSGAPTSWNWDFGDGSGSSVENPPSYSYLTSGIYTVTLEVSDGPNLAEYSRVVPVGNINETGFNANPYGEGGSESITWTSTFIDNAYSVGQTIAVPVMWQTTCGPTQFVSVTQDGRFTPGPVTGTSPAVVGEAEDGVLFTMEFTRLHQQGRSGPARGKVNLLVEVLVDGNCDGTVDTTAQLGVNVEVTQP